MYKLADIKWNVENQDLYRNRDDFWKNFKQKILFVNLKDFIFNKYICKIYKL